VRVVVTGATSLLGRTLARLLVDRGDEVIAFQRHAGAGLHEEVLGDITDANAVSLVMEGADAVVHLAARVGATGPWTAFLATNVDGTANVVRAAGRAGVKRVVYVSSPSVAHGGSSIVGDPAGPADPDAAHGFYAKSKAMAERVAMDADTNDMAVVAIRPHLVWGPGDTQLVGRIVDRARDGRLAVVGTGAALIDTTYIDNAADALVAALDRAPVLGGRALVVTNGQPRPVGEILGAIVAAAGLKPVQRRVPFTVARESGRLIERIWERRNRDDDPPMTPFLAEQLGTAHWFDQRQTRELLGWEPAVGLDEGFRRLRSWYAGT
jgi:nucleoside-diphosphate-sugar epimerase